MLIYRIPKYYFVITIITESANSNKLYIFILSIQIYYTILIVYVSNIYVDKLIFNKYICFRFFRTIIILCSVTKFCSIENILFVL